MLPENYQNEILNSQMGNRRQYRIIENNNGTVSFIDVSVYDQEGSLFDAEDINDITTQINLNLSNINSIQNILQTGVVNGIKGVAESEYRVGQVTLSAANLNAYTKTEVDNLISAVGGMHFELVSELPTTNISISAIYLIPSSNSRSSNKKDEYIYIPNNSYTDFTSHCDVEENAQAFPAEGESDVYYIDLDTETAYVWNETTSEYVVSSDYTVSSVTELPTIGEENVLYVLSNDNSVHTCTIADGWEQIGSTSVDLGNYYTKTEIDTNALISVSEFEAM